jgi:hypothetical protein
MATGLVVRTYHRPADLIRGVTMTLEATTPETTRLRFEVCGPDVTQIPRGFPLGFGFDTAIRQVEVTTDQVAMAMQTSTVAQQVTVSLARDPFLSPEPWKVTVLLDFERCPGQGRLTLGDSLMQAIPPLRGTVEESIVVLGTRCEEAYAARATADQPPFTRPDARPR